MLRRAVPPQTMALRWSMGDNIERPVPRVRLHELWAQDALYSRVIFHNLGFSWLPRNSSSRSTPLGFS